jgi:hypothetical protein
MSRLLSLQIETSDDVFPDFNNSTGAKEYLLETPGVQTPRTPRLDHRARKNIKARYFSL